MRCYLSRKERDYSLDFYAKFVLTFQKIPAFKVRHKLFHLPHLLWNVMLISHLLWWFISQVCSYSLLNRSSMWKNYWETWVIKENVYFSFESIFPGLPLCLSVPEMSYQKLLVLSAYLVVNKSCSHLTRKSLDVRSKKQTHRAIHGKKNYSFKLEIVGIINAFYFEDTEDSESLSK